ncbi:MAG TPA: hypothetical protein VFC46_02230, partial [Humisphaera sp.]|nr:hypothetical protein [Humisphaera sp.]
VKLAADALAKATDAAAKAIGLAKNKTDVTLLIPADLPVGDYDLAFRAEMLSRDGQRVMATRYTSVKRMNAISPVLVQLDGPRRIEATVDPKTGATVKWSGRIERHEGATGDVVVALEGLPKGVLDTKVTVPADKTEWKLELKIPPTVEVGETAGIKLFATIKADPKVDGLARSPNVELALNLLAVKEAGKDAK